MLKHSYIILSTLYFSHMEMSSEKNNTGCVELIEFDRFFMRPWLIHWYTLNLNWLMKILKIKCSLKTNFRNSQCEIIKFLYVQTYLWLKSILKQHKKKIWLKQSILIIKLHCECILPSETGLLSILNPENFSRSRRESRLSRRY